MREFLLLVLLVVFAPAGLLAYDVTAADLEATPAYDAPVQLTAPDRIDIAIDPFEALLAPPPDRQIACYVWDTERCILEVHGPPPRWQSG